MTRAAEEAKRRGFEPEEVRKAACTGQRWYRELHAMHMAFGPMMFSCSGRMAERTGSHLSGSRTARFIRVADTTM